MTEHRRNILVTDCLEANAYYNGRLKYAHNPADAVIAEAYLMRVETITGGE